MNKEEIEKEMKILEKKMQKEYQTLENTPRQQELFKQYKELEDKLKGVK